MTAAIAQTIEVQVVRHGEPYRRLITDSMTWFADRHPELSIDWDVYVDELIDHAVTVTVLPKEG